MTVETQGAAPAAAPAGEAAPSAAVPPPAPVAAPKSDADFRAAALAQLEQLATTKPPAEGEAGTQEDAQGQANEPVDSTDAPAKATDASAAEKESAEEKPRSKLELRALTAVARANRELRAREEALKRREAEVDPIIKARQAGDPIAYLMAGGFSYEQATQAVLDGRAAPKKPTEEPTANPELLEMRKELTDLRKHLASEKDRAARAEFFGTLTKVAASDEFELVQKYAQHPRLKAHERVLEVLEEHFQNTHRMPGKTLEESVRIAAEYVENELEEQTVAPVLTTKKVRGRLSDADTKRESVSGPRAKSGQSQSPTTLTNAAVSGAPVRGAPPKPRTDEEFRAAAIRVLEGRGG